MDYSELANRLLGQEYGELEAGRILQVHAARAGTALPSGAFQGGGTVSAVTAFALKKHVLEAAILTDQQDVWPFGRLVTTEQEALSCAGSKFCAAPTLSAFNRSRNQGYTHLGAEKLIIREEETRTEIPLADVRGFIPESCLLCPDMTSEWSDISVGMFEGGEGPAGYRSRESQGRSGPEPKGGPALALLMEKPHFAKRPEGRPAHFSWLSLLPRRL